MEEEQTHEYILNGYTRTNTHRLLEMYFCELGIYMFLGVLGVILLCHSFGDGILLGPEVTLEI